MNSIGMAGALFAAVTAFAVLFQLALAGGAPWGELAMGGRFPGRLPWPMRVVAIAQGAFLVALIGVVLARAGLVAGEPGRLIWLPVCVSAVSLAMNAVSPSVRERRLWTPVAAMMFGASLFVAWTAGPVP